MVTKARRSDRRTEALSKRRIVEAAIAILDAGGESALTVRALSARLSTGSGAIYWHVVDKTDLLATATDDVIARVMTGLATMTDPAEAIRAIALGLFDAIDAHPWVGAQLPREPSRYAMLQIVESLGRQVEALGVPARAQFDTAAALGAYILGVAGQNAANARLDHGTDRAAFLSAVAEQWAGLDPADYPFTRRMAAQLREHDDREQFLAGVDLILAGIATLA